MGTKQKCRISRHILDAGCCYKAGSFTLSFLPCRLPELFTVRFTPSVDFTEGDAIAIKGRKFTIKTRTMEEPAGKLFSAGAVVQCDIDMEQNLAFITTGGEAQAGAVSLGSALPEMDGTASAGSSTSVSREDHIHPTDTSRVSTSFEINTEAPLTGGGDLTADRTIGISPATAATETEAGEPGSVVYAPDNAGASVRDQAVTPAGLAAGLAAAAGNPPGTIIHFAGTAAPAGYLVCDGSAMSRTAYSSLFAAIGTIYGSGDDSTTFNLPNFQGRFLRGCGGNSAAVGVAQGDAIRNITGGLSYVMSDMPSDHTSGAITNYPISLSYYYNVTTSKTAYKLSSLNFNASRVVPTSTENRPINYAVLMCIKY